MDFERDIKEWIKIEMEGIKDSKIYIYKGLGHGTFEEAKDFYDRIIAFCQ